MDLATDEHDPTMYPQFSPPNHLHAVELYLEVAEVHSVEMDPDYTTPDENTSMIHADTSRLSPPPGALEPTVSSQQRSRPASAFKVSQVIRATEGGVRECYGKER